MPETLPDKGLAGRVRGDLLNLLAVFSMIGAVPASGVATPLVWFLIALGLAFVGVIFAILMTRFHDRSDLGPTAKRLHMAQIVVLWGAIVIVSIVNFGLLAGDTGWTYARSWILLSFFIAFYVGIQVVSAVAVWASDVLHYRLSGAFAVFGEFVIVNFIFVVFAATLMVAYFSWSVGSSQDLLAATIVATIGTGAWLAIEAVNFLRHRRRLVREEAGGSLLSAFKSLFQIGGCLLLGAYLWIAFALRTGLELAWGPAEPAFWPGVVLASIGTGLGVLHGYLSIRRRHGAAPAAAAA